MLFFFELLLFVLVMVTLAIGEFVSRGAALGLWLVATAFTVGGYFLARGALAPVLVGESSEPATSPHSQSGEVPTPLDERWARTLLYNWRRANVLLLIGLLVVGGWYWLGT
jgi:hypothetical protein